MIYLPQISPINFTQIVEGSNLSPDVGGTFETIAYVDFKHIRAVNEAIKFQFMSDTANPVVQVGGTAVSLTDITPSGWAGDGNYVYEASYTPTAAGYIYFFIVEGGNYFESTCIEVVESTEGLVKIEYSNSENDYGYVDGSELISYFDGDLGEVQPFNDIVGYQNDRGKLTKLRSTPVEGYELSIYRVPYFVVNQLNMLFSCDTIEINGVLFQNEDELGVERLGESDLFNVTLTIKRVADSYTKHTESESGFALIGDANDNLISDNSGNLLI